MIDTGPSIPEQWIKVDYVKTTSSGYILTSKGIEWFTITFQELYNEITKIHKELDSLWTKKNCSSCTGDDVCRSDENRDGEV